MPRDRGFGFSTIAQNSSEIILHAMHALVIFIFNSQAKDILRSLFTHWKHLINKSICKQENQVVPISSMNATKIKYVTC